MIFLCSFHYFFLIISLLMNTFIRREKEEVNWNVILLPCLKKSWSHEMNTTKLMNFCYFVWFFWLLNFLFFLLLSSPIYNSWCRDEWTLCHDNLEYKCCFSPLFLSSQVCTGAGAARDWKTPSWFLDLLEEDLTEQSGCWWLPVRLTHSPIPTGRKPPIS